MENNKHVPYVNKTYKTDGGIDTPRMRELLENSMKIPATYTMQSECNSYHISKNGEIVARGLIKTIAEEILESVNNYSRVCGELAATKALLATMEGSETTYRALYNKERKKGYDLKPLESEKDMNAILTNEVESLRAQNAALSSALGDALKFIDMFADGAKANIVCSLTVGAWQQIAELKATLANHPTTQTIQSEINTEIESIKVGQP